MQKIKNVIAWKLGKILELKIIFYCIIRINDTKLSAHEEGQLYIYIYIYIYIYNNAISVM